MSMAYLMRRVRRTEKEHRKALDAVAAEAQRLVAAGVSRTTIAREAGVAEATVRKWLRRGEAKR